MKNHAFLIDDDPMQLCMGKFLINKHNIFKRTACYTCAANALEYLKKNYQNSAALPDTILLDLDMPTLSGWDFLSLVSKLKRFVQNEIKVYVVSSSIDEKAKRLLSRYQFVKGAYLKPITIEILHDIVSAGAFNESKQARVNQILM